MGHLPPYCRDCYQPRDSRSPRCAECREKHRARRKDITQKKRRATPLRVPRADALRIRALAALLAESSDELANWLAQPRVGGSDDARPGASTNQSSTSGSRMNGGDYARAQLTAVQDLLTHLRRVGLVKEPPAQKR